MAELLETKAQKDTFLVDTQKLRKYTGLAHKLRILSEDGIDVHSEFAEHVAVFERMYLKTRYDVYYALRNSASAYLQEGDLIMSAESNRNADYFRKNFLVVRSKPYWLQVVYRQQIPHKPNLRLVA